MQPRRIGPVPDLIFPIACFDRGHSFAILIVVGAGRGRVFLRTTRLSGRSTESIQPQVMVAAESSLEESSNGLESDKERC